MTFLAPFAAVVGGAIAAPVLVAFYILRLRRRRVRVSSILFWDRSARDLEVNVPFRRLRPSWLLALQMLALALLLAALARPALEGAGGAASRAVILIDRSASMSVRDGPGGVSRLDEAKARALRLIDRLTRGASARRVMVVEFAAAPRAVTGLSRDRAALRAAVGEIGPTDQPGDLAAAIELISAVLTAGDEEPDPGRALVVLISDGDFARPPPRRLGGAEVRFDRVGTAPPAAPPPNTGIVAFNASRDYRDPARVRVFARLVQTGPARTVTLTLARGTGPDAEVIERRSVTPRPEGELLVAAESFEFDDDGGGVVTVALSGTTGVGPWADALAADDRAALVLAPQARPGALLVVPDGEPVPASAAGPGAAPSAAGPGALLLDVLDAMELTPLRATTSAGYDELVSGGGLAGFDVVVFDRVTPRAPPAGPSISFGAAVPGLRLAEASGGGGGFTSWSRAHPVMRDVSLDAVVCAGARVVVADEAAAGETGAEETGADPAVVLTELARNAAGPVVVLAQHGAVRRVVVGFELARSTWPVDYGFPIFLANAVEHVTLRGSGRAGAWVSTTDAAEATPAAREVVLRGAVEARLPAPPGGATVRFGVLELAGVYPLEGAVEPALAVNLFDATESRAGVAGALSIGGEAVAPGRDAAGGAEEVWPWFVAAAGVVLVVEWLLNALYMRT